MDRNDIQAMIPNFLMTGGMPAPRKSWRTHDHPFWEVILYTVGTGVATVGGKPIPFYPGTIICNPPGVGHAEDSEEGFQNRWVAIRELQTSTEIPVVRLDTGHPLFGIVPMIQVEQGLKRTNSEMILRNLFNTFMLYLNEHLAHDPCEQRIKHIERIILSNVENPRFRLNQAFGEIPLSKDHIRRLFTERTGKTPVQYLIDLRMERAKELLGMGFSVKETADKVGLPDQYYFSRLFRKTQGVSPSMFGHPQR